MPRIVHSMFDGYDEIVLVPIKGALRLEISRRGALQCVVVEIGERELLSAVAQVHQLTHAPDFVEQLDAIDEVAKLLGLTPVVPPTTPAPPG